MKKIILSFVLVIILVACVGGLGVIQSNKAKTATSTVQMDLNPGATFVVNSNNIVLSVAFTNEDADLIYSDIKTVGRSIEEVAKDFTQKAIEASSTVKKYIDIDVTSSGGSDANCITITVSGNKEQCEKLQTALVSKINGVFDENGIFGRAVANIKTQTTNLAQKYAEIAQDLKLDAQQFANKTEAEVLAIINERGKQLEGLTSGALSQVEDFINGTVITSLQNAVNAIQTQIANTQTQIETIQQNIQSKKAEIAEWQQQLSNALPALKETLQGYINLANQAIDGFNAEINELKLDIKEWEAQAKAKLAEINKKISVKVAELKETAQAQFATLKNTLAERINAHKSALNAHKQAFEANKEAQLAQIKAWRESFNA